MSGFPSPAEPGSILTALAVAGFFGLGYLLLRPHGWFGLLLRSRKSAPHQVRLPVRPSSIAGMLASYLPPVQPGPIRGQDGRDPEEDR